MAVQSATSRIQYAGNNSTVTSYAVPFVFLENAHLQAIARTSAGVESTVTLTNHTGAGDVNGGTVRTAVAVPVASTLTIYREVPATQTTSYQEGGDFPAASHERALDKLTFIAQQNERIAERSIRVSEADGTRNELDAVANTVIGLDANKQPKTMTASDLKTYLSLSGVTLDVDAGMKTFADAGERALAVPDFTGQLGTQRNTGETYVSTGASAGNWARSGAPLFVSDYANGTAAAAAAYAAGKPLYVRAGETAVLECNPSNGDDFPAMCRWAATCIKEGPTPAGASTDLTQLADGRAAELYIELANGGHDVGTTANSYVYLNQPYNVVDIRASAAPDLIAVTGISYAAVSGTTYRATVTLSSTIPAGYSVGDPVGMMNIQGDEDALSANGGQIIESITGTVGVDATQFTFDFSSPKGAPTTPTALSSTAINGVSPNRAVFPKAWLRADSTGWDGGAIEGYFNVYNGSQLHIRHIGVAYNGSGGNEKDLFMVFGAGSLLQVADYSVFAGAGDKVIRIASGGEAFINRLMCGGAAKAAELVSLSVNAKANIIRSSFGGSITSNIQLGSGCSLFGGQSISASSGRGVYCFGAGAAAAWQESQISNCSNGAYVIAGTIFMATGANNRVERCSNGVRWMENYGIIYARPNFTGNFANERADDPISGFSYMRTNKAVTNADATAYAPTSGNAQTGIGPTLYLYNSTNANDTVGGQVVFGMRETPSYVRMGATGGTAPAMFVTTANAERLRVNATGASLVGDTTVTSATTAASATAGSSGDVPAQVVGYLVVSINGTSRKIPYYAT